jgi:hypothetical protein
MRPVDDFRIQFRHVIERAITRTDGDPRKFRKAHDFDEFMLKESILCSTARDLAIAFMSRYFPVYLHSGLRLALYLGTVSYLSARSSRRDMDSSDMRALKELQEIENTTETELTNWIDAHFPSIR